MLMSLNKSVSIIQDDKYNSSSVFREGAISGHDSSFVS